MSGVIYFFFIWKYVNEILSDSLSSINVLVDIVLIYMIIHTQAFTNHSSETLSHSDFFAGAEVLGYCWMKNHQFAQIVNHRSAEWNFDSTSKIFILTPGWPFLLTLGLEDFHGGFIPGLYSPVFLRGSS